MPEFGMDRFRRFGPPGIPRPPGAPPMPTPGENRPGGMWPGGSPPDNASAGFGSPVPAAPESPESVERERRFQQIITKETWTFNGKPFHARLVGYADGIAHFKSLDDEHAPVSKRYARRFSDEDISDIIFYAQYKRIPLGNLGRVHAMVLRELV